ncbi:MAG TPA: 16S rRNA (cytosine(1402)-N(4))-methyltransferase RsmH [Terriglobales bacterium]
MSDPGHVAVMADEVIEYMAPRPGGLYVDCTLGGGGHSLRLAQAMGWGRIIGFDKDPEALAAAAARMAEQTDLPRMEFEFIHADFAAVPTQLRARGWKHVDGAVADLGMSSMQVNRAERGFSFAADGPLDMRMNPEQELTAEQVVNQADERELADLIYQFGEERRSRRIARAIVRSRPLHTTAQLAAVVAAANRPVNRRRPGLHPATRTFQALRIYVNSEIDSLTDWLAHLPEWLAPEGRAVVISFHSLEDRPVKQSFRAGAQQGRYRVLTPHAVRPTEAETARNPRARSARLRAVERLASAGEGGEDGHLLHTAN